MWKNLFFHLFMILTIFFLLVHNHPFIEHIFIKPLLCAKLCTMNTEVNEAGNITAL